MANLYGVSNTPLALTNQTLIGNASIVCPAGVETNIFQTPALQSLDRGVYYPVVWAYITLQFGATVPSALLISLRINNGADIVTIQNFVDTTKASLAEYYFFVAAGPPSTTAFLPPGVPIQISVNSGAQSCTAAIGYCNALMGIFRANDQ